jgi:hypothetical protein
MPYFEESQCTLYDVPFVFDYVVMFLFPICSFVVFVLF